jgi:hypothetical protein
MRGECGVNTGTNGNELPVDPITSFGRKLVVVSPTIGECPGGLSRVAEQRSYRVLPLQRILVGHFANCI